MLAASTWCFFIDIPRNHPVFLYQGYSACTAISNSIAIVMLFLTGFSLGRYSGSNPWRIGFCMVIVGIILVGITIALGG